MFGNKRLTNYDDQNNKRTSSNKDDPSATSTTNTTVLPENSDISRNNSNLSSIGSNQCILVDRNSINTKTSIEEGLPHLVLYRLWVDNSVECQNLLESLCSFGFESLKPQFCINPHHYRKKTILKNLDPLPAQSIMKRSSFRSSSSIDQKGYDESEFHASNNLISHISQSNTAFADYKNQHHQITNSQSRSNIDFIVFYYEKNVQVGPTFKIPCESFIINGRFRSCWTQSLDGNSPYSSIISNGMLCIGGLSGLKNDHKSQLLKLRLYNGIQVRIEDKIIDKKITDRYIRLENHSILPIHLKFTKLSKDLNVQDLRSGKYITFETINPNNGFSLFSFNDFEEALLKFTLSGYDTFFEAIQQITNVNISLDEPWSSQFRYNTKGSVTRKNSSRDPSIKSPTIQSDYNKIKHLNSQKLSSRQSNAIDEPFGDNCDDNDIYDNNCDNKHPTSWLTIRFNMFTSIIDKILEKYHKYEMTSM